MVLMDVLKERFDRNTAWHPDLSWEQVEQRLQGDPRVLDVLARMEATGGEPAVIGTDEDGRIIFADCSRETPALRRSLCYDDIALRMDRNAEVRKKLLGKKADLSSFANGYMYYGFSRTDTG